MSAGRYRMRTWLRGHLPGVIGPLFPKGMDCGAHEFYRRDAETDACYHCRAARAREPQRVTDEAVELLVRSARAGSRPAMDALARLVVEGSVRVTPADLAPGRESLPI